MMGPFSVGYAGTCLFPLIKSDQQVSFIRRKITMIFNLVLKIMQVSGLMQGQLNRCKQVNTLLYSIDNQIILKDYHADSI